MFDPFDSGSAAQANRIFGVVTGIVVDNQHPGGEYAVKVKFPWIRESDKEYTGGQPDPEDFFSSWARVVQLMAGKERGLFVLPEVDDEVLVAFEQGDMRRPFVIGALWNGKDEPPYDNLAQEGKNNITTFLSRSGHCLQFVDDADGKRERIVLQTKIVPTECTAAHTSRDGHFIVIDHSDGAEKIEIYDRHQNQYILIDSTNKKITMESKDGDILLKAGQGITLESGSGDITIRSGEGGKFETKSNYQMKAGGSAKQESSGNHVIKGAKVQIN